MDVREALALVAADVDRGSLAPASAVRAHGDRMVRRRRSALAALTVAVVAVGAVTVGHSVSRSRPQPARPSPKPTPSAPLVVLQGCGHGQGCPGGPGPFRAVMDASPAGTQLAVDVTLPDGWIVHEVDWDVVRFGPSVRRPAPASDQSGLALVWPVRPPSGASDAFTTATQLAGLPGVSSAPTAATVDGHRAWQVHFFSAPTTGAAKESCIDPRYGSFPDEDYDPSTTPSGQCHPLFDVVWTDDITPGTQRDAVGFRSSAPVTVTLLDSPGIATPAGHGMLAIWTWGTATTQAGPAGDLLGRLHLGRFTNPSCGPAANTPPCVVTGGTYVVHGDPVLTTDGVTSWGRSASVQVPTGWSVSDDGRGNAWMASQTGTASAAVVWDPQLPGPPRRALIDAKAWATDLAARTALVAGPVVQTQVGGAPAWRVDLRPRPGATPFTQSDPAYEDTRCGVGPYFSVALACASAASSAATGLFLASNEQARVWIVQAAPDHVLLIGVWGKRWRHADPPPLPPALTAAGHLIGAVQLTSTTTPATTS
jgi:hypothetical protein